MAESSHFWACDDGRAGNRHNVAMSESKVIITALTDGPLEVAGDVEILAADGSVIKETDKSYLCRCGHSAKKPFCDGAHKKEGFTAP